MLLLHACLPGNDFALAAVRAYACTVKAAKILRANFSPSSACGTNIMVTALKAGLKIGGY